MDKQEVEDAMEKADKEEVVDVEEVEIVMVAAAAEGEPRQEVPVVHDAEVGQGVEVAKDAQEHAVLQVIDLCLEAAAVQWHHQDDDDLDLDQDQIKNFLIKISCFVFT